MKVIRIKQGDAYAIPIALRLNGEALDVSLITRAEFMVGYGVRRMYPAEVPYVNGAFWVPLTQAQTLAMGEGVAVPVDVRVRFSGGNVIGASYPAAALIVDALSGSEV